MEDVMEHRVRALEEDSRRNQETHRGYFARFESMAVDYARIDSQYAHIMATLASVQVSIEELKAKPGKRWESVIAAIITGVVGFVVAYVMRGG